MQISNKTAESYYNNLMSIANKVTGKLAYAISRNIRKLNEELREYHEIKNKCIQTYGELDEDGIYSLKIDSPKFNDFIKEMGQYDNIEISVDLMKIMPEDVYDSSLSASELLLIDFMIEEE